MATIAARAADLGVAVQILSTFALGRSALAGLVLGYGAIATAQIREGLRMLKRCFEREESRR